MEPGNGIRVNKGDRLLYHFNGKNKPCTAVGKSFIISEENKGKCASVKLAGYAFPKTVQIGKLSVPKTPARSRSPMLVGSKRRATLRQHKATPEVEQAVNISGSSDTEPQPKDNDDRTLSESSASTPMQRQTSRRISVSPTQSSPTQSSQPQGSIKSPKVKTFELSSLDAGELEFVGHGLADSAEKFGTIVVQYAESEDTFKSAAVKVCEAMAVQAANDEDLSKVWLLITGHLVVNVCKEEHDPFEFAKLLSQPNSHMDLDKLAKNRAIYETQQAIASESMSPSGSTIPIPSFKTLMTNKRKKYNRQLAYYLELFARVLKIPIPEIELLDNLLKGPTNTTLPQMLLRCGKKRSVSSALSLESAEKNRDGSKSSSRSSSSSSDLSDTSADSDPLDDAAMAALGAGERAIRQLREDNRKFHKAVKAASKLLEDEGLDKDERPAIKATLNVAKAGLQSTYKSLKTLHVDNAHCLDKNSGTSTADAKKDIYLYLHCPLPPKELVNRVDEALDTINRELMESVLSLKKKLEEVNVEYQGLTSRYATEEERRDVRSDLLSNQLALKAAEDDLKLVPACREMMRRRQPIWERNFLLPLMGKQGCITGKQRHTFLSGRYLSLEGSHVTVVNKVSTDSDAFFESHGITKPEDRVRLLEALLLESTKEYAPTRIALGDIDPRSKFRIALQPLLNKSMARSSAPINMTVPTSKGKKAKSNANRKERSDVRDDDSIEELTEYLTTDALNAKSGEFTLLRKDGEDLTAKILDNMRSIANATTEQLNDIYKSSKTGASKGLSSNENFSKYKEKQFSEEMVKYLKSIPYLRDKPIASAVIEACRIRLGAKKDGARENYLKYWDKQCAPHSPDLPAALARHIDPKIVPYVRYNARDIDRPTRVLFLNTGSPVDLINMAFFYNTIPGSRARGATFVGFVGNVDVYDQLSEETDGEGISFPSALVTEFSRQISDPISVTFVANPVDLPDAKVMQARIVYVVRKQLPVNSPLFLESFLIDFNPSHIVIDRLDPATYINFVYLSIAFVFADCLYITEHVESEINSQAPDVIFLPREFRTLVRNTHELDFEGSKKNQTPECYVMYDLALLRKERPNAIPAMLLFIKYDMPKLLLRQAYGEVKVSRNGSRRIYEWHTEANHADGQRIKKNITPKGPWENTGLTLFSYIRGEDMHDKSYPPMTSYYTVNVDASEVVDNQVVQSGTISFYSKLTGRLVSDKKSWTEMYADYLLKTPSDHEHIGTEHINYPKLFHAMRKKAEAKGTGFLEFLLDRIVIENGRNYESDLFGEESRPMSFLTDDERDLRVVDYGSIEDSEFGPKLQARANTYDIHLKHNMSDLLSPTRLHKLSVNIDAAQAEESDGSSCSSPKETKRVKPKKPKKQRPHVKKASYQEQEGENIIELQSHKTNGGLRTGKVEQNEVKCAHFGCPCDEENRPLIACDGCNNYYCGEGVRQHTCAWTNIKEMRRSSRDRDSSLCQVKNRHRVFFCSKKYTVECEQFLCQNHYCREHALPTSHNCDGLDDYLHDKEELDKATKDKYSHEQETGRRCNASDCDSDCEEPRCFKCQRLFCRAHASSVSHSCADDNTWQCFTMNCNAIVTKDCLACGEYFCETHSKQTQHDCPKCRLCTHADDSDTVLPCSICSRKFCSNHIRGHKCRPLASTSGSSGSSSSAANQVATCALCTICLPDTLYKCTCSETLQYCGNHVQQDNHDCSLLRPTPNSSAKSKMGDTGAPKKAAANLSSVSTAKRSSVALQAAHTVVKRTKTYRLYCFVCGYDVHWGYKCPVMTGKNCANYTDDMRNATEHCTILNNKRHLIKGSEKNLLKRK